MDEPLFEQMAEMEERHWWFRGRRRIVHRLVDRLALGEDALVVDAGCGTGANAASLSSRYRVLGVDPTPAAIERARRFRARDLTFECGTVASVLEETGARASLLLLLDVIEHVPDDAGLLGDALRYVRPGGHVLLTVPAEMRLWSPHDEAFGHYRRYDREGLRALLAGLPLELLLLSHFNARLYPLIRAVRALNSSMPSRAGSASSLRKSDLRRYPTAVNAVLESIFAGESGRLERVLAGSARPYRVGASLVALARRTPG